MNLKFVIESILFVHGEPVKIEFLAKITRQKKEEVVKALDDLGADYGERGIRLLKKEDEYQLGSAPENAKWLEYMIKSEFSEELSRAALETLAIVAYKGPLTRAEIEHIRGVNSSFTLRNLLLRSIIERIENPKDARSYIYRISFDTLKYFGITKVEDLPEYQSFKEKKMDILEE